MKRRLFTQSLLAALLLNLHGAEGCLRIGTFKEDVTPPLESPLCHGNVMPVKQVVTPLLARGVVILGAGSPIVLAEHRLGGRFSTAPLDQRVFHAIADAARKCMAEAESVTQVGFGSGKIEKVASNRRVLGPDGRVAFTRMSASKHPQAA